MDDWFGDPFFGGGMGSGMRDFHSHFEAMEKHMNDMMGSMFRSMGDFHRGMGLTFQDDPHLALEDHSRRGGSERRTGGRAEEVEGPRRSGGKQPIVEEPGEERPRRATEPQGYYYTSSMSAYQGPDGIGHAKKKTYDSRSGKTEMAEMRKLGDQAVAKKREIDRDGRVTEQLDRKNVNDGDVESFGQRWSAKSRETPSYALPGRTGGSNRRALK
jgi:hypothetical protein